MKKPLIIPLSKIKKDDTGLVGVKTARLADLSRNDFPVPKAFAVTTEAFKVFLEKNNLMFLTSRLSVARNRNILERICRKLQEEIKKKKVPSEVAKEILTNAKKLRTSCFSVRSSATSEDLSFASFAGQFESYLNVPFKDLLQFLKTCWVSLYEERVLSYTLYHQIPMHQIKMATLIQEMIKTEKGGVIFTKDIARDNDRVIIIEAVKGLTETVVGGVGVPDHYMVDKKDLKIIGQRLKSKKPILSSEEIFELAKTALLVENLYETPQDIEWSIRKGKVYLLQSRPITA